MPLSALERKIGIGVLAFGAVVILVVPIVLHSRLNTALADAHSARAATAQVLERAQLASRTADSLRSAAGSALAQRDSALRVANAQARRGDQLAGGFRALAKTAPDTCRTIIVLADSALAVKDSAIGALHGALEASDAASERFRAGLDSSQAALTALRASTVTLSAATASLERSTHTGFLFRLARILPRPGFGLAAGVDNAGKPHLIAGFTAGWTF